ncbi:MAG: class I adenylate-forming enzyme family protein [Acidimicrobiia bacterium]
MNAGEMLTTTATSYPDRVAWVWDDRTRTYGESNRRADALVHALVELGVGRGDRVAVFMQNRPEAMESFFAVLKVGAAAVPLNPRFTAEEIDYHVADSGARVLIVGDEVADVVVKVRDRLTSVEHVICVNGGEEGMADFEAVLAPHDGEPFTAVDVEGDELAWLAYTSGTTGRAKGAMLTHGNLVACALGALADTMRLEVEDVALHAASLTHGSGYNALAYTMKGCTQVLLQPAGFDVEKFLEFVPRYRVNALFMVPTMIKMVIDHPDARHADLSSLRWVMYGGAPMYVEDLKKALDLMGPVFVQIYGQTESPMTGTMLRPQEHVVDGPLAHRLGSCGRARSGMQIRILDEHDNAVPTGEKGEICIRGATVMQGYWQRPDATAETLRGGWLHTGDIGCMDEHGYVYILDRTRDMVISGGLNVYPREVEELLLTHPAVSEVCVFGVPDEKWGEALKAHVVLVAGQHATAEEIITYAGQHLAGYKKPKSVDFVTELPKTTYGKLDKKAVRAPYWAGQERMVR